jgi:UDP-N-acetylglucosamine:LPS N-acetylglucosamine transferase
LKERHIIVYTLQSLEDPLAKGLVLEYLLSMDKKDQFFFHFITHEHKEYHLGPDTIKKRKEELAEKNIFWYPVDYRNGGLVLINRVLNFIGTFFIARKIKKRYAPKAIMGFLSIPGAFCYLLSKWLHLKLIVYCFEPHSDYMADFKIWKKTGLKYRLLHLFEKKQLEHAEEIVVPNRHTEKLASLLKKENARLHICPVCIDTDLMQFDSKAREQIRSQLGIGDKTVIIYTGKFDGIYYSADEVIAFFKKLYDHDQHLYFYIITPNAEEVRKSLSNHKLPDSAIHVSGTVAYGSLHKHISAADIGFVALPPLPSQKYRTPVKSAIYLSCGIPYLVNKNIAEDDVIAVEKNVGVVINDLDEDPSAVVSKIKELLSDNEHHNRCRTEAVKTRSIPVTKAILEKIFLSV